MCGDVHSAEELVHDAFLKAMTSWETLQGLTYTQQRAWMYRTVRNLFVDRYRKHQRELLAGYVFDGEQTGGSSSPKPPAESSRENEILWGMVLSQLAEEERALFIMRYLMGYTSKELGDMYSLPPGTVRSKLHSAKKKIREALRADTKGE